MSNIKITLCSDLCIASGEGYSSMIDTDICFDETGIPLIPSRRLKGVLREAAELIGVEQKVLDNIFGVRGNHTSGSLILENAFLNDGHMSYDEIHEDLKDEDKEKVLSLFTYIRTATAIDEETGSAKKDTLRFTRVVKQFSPKSNQPFSFLANCWIEPQYEQVMSRICKALRSIGYRRNRGFGAVRCVFEAGKAEEIKEKNQNVKQLLVPELEDNIRYQIPVYLTNTAPLIISAAHDDETEDYITGTALLGALAWRYPNKNAVRFQELFLNKEVIFSNLYPGDRPIPLCYAKSKRDGTYTNRVQENTSDLVGSETSNLSMESHMDEKDKLKPLTDSYMDEEGCIVIPKKEVIYHHTKKSDSLLYMQTALCAGQRFAGSLQGKGKELQEILRLLEKKTTIQIGKSKTAQYANCKVTWGEAVPVSPQKLIITKSDSIVIYLQSDVILYENGVNTCDCIELLMALHLPWLTTREMCEKCCDMEKSFVLFKSVMGYSGVWNLKKPHSKAFKAGSVLVLQNAAGEIERDYFIGAKINEGFGHCKVMLLQEMQMIQESNGCKASNMSQDSRLHSQNKGLYAGIIKHAGRRGELMEKAIRHAESNPNKLPPALISDSQIGRVRLMLKQAEDVADLKKRIDAIVAKSVSDRFRECIDLEVRDTEFWEYRLFWDTVLRWHRFQRKIQRQEAKGGEAT